MTDTKRDALVALADSFPELNMSNYTEADVDALNSWGCDVFDAIRALAASAPEQAVDLWCLHVQGPDDVCPAPSKAHAQKAADMLNEAFKSIEDAPRAVAALWPHSPESHAEAVGAFIVDWLIPRAHIDALQAGLRPAGLSDATRVADDVMHGWRLGTSGVAEQDARKLAEKLQGSAHNAAYDLAEKFMKRVHQLNREAATQADDPVMNNWLAGQALAFNEAAKCVTYATTWPKPATHRPADAADSKGVGDAARLPLPLPGVGVAFIDTPQHGGDAVYVPTLADSIPRWCVENILLVSAWMKARGHESWQIGGIGPLKLTADQEPGA